MKQYHSFHKKSLLGLAAITILAGFFSFRSMKTGLFPDITFPKLKVIADAGEQPVDKMMATVTVPLENAIKQTEGLDISAVLHRAAVAKFPFTLNGMLMWTWHGCR